MLSYVKTKKCHCRKKWGGGGGLKSPSLFRRPCLNIVLSLVYKTGHNWPGLVWHYDLNANILFLFKQSKISQLIPHIYVFGLLCNFLVIFGYTWGIKFITIRHF